MSAIFRQAFRLARPAQPPHGVLTRGAGGDTVQPAHFAAGGTAFVPSVRSTLAPALHANTNTFHAPAAAQSGVKAAPLVASGGAIFAPGIATPSFHLTGVLTGGGGVRRARARATWPNLALVEAPPWRLTVVTPETARVRARGAMARRRRRAQEAARERDIERRIAAILDQLVEDEVARIVVRLVAEAA